MCVTAAVAAAVTAVAAVAGTVASIDNANYQAKMMEFQLQEQRAALRGEAEAARLQAMEEQANRLREFEAQRAANLAAIAGQTGFGQNMSYLQGIEAAEEKALKTDLTNIRLGLAGERNRIQLQARGTQWQSKLNASARKSAVVGSLIQGVQGLASAASMYSSYSTGRPPVGGQNTGTVTIGGATGSWK